MTMIQESVDQHQQWKQLVFERFLEILHAPYGDFQAIGHLAHAINDAESLQQAIDYLSTYPHAKHAIQKHLPLGEVDLQQLHELPQETLGYRYSDHMLRNNLKPITTQPVDSDLNFVTTHMAEVHDIWHIMADADVDMPGEMKLHAFTAAQLRCARFSFAMLAKNLMKATVDDLALAEQLMDALTEGWLMGKRAKPIFGLQWQTLWQVPVKQLQAEWNISPQAL
jgi:ubiquinone biosynthesis protein COQ4